MRTKLYALFTLISLVSSRALLATDHTWTGAGNTTSWNLTTNWSPTTVPTSADKVIIPTTLTGTRKFPIITSTTSPLAVCADIVFNNGGTVYPRLTCTGSGFASSGYLTVYGNFTNNTGTTAACSTVVVLMDRSVASPPTVSITGSTNFKQLALKSTSSTTGQSFTVSIPSGTTVGITEYIEVTKGTGSGSAGTLSVAGTLDLLADPSVPSTAYVRASSSYGTGEITNSGSGKVNVRATAFAAQNYQSGNTYDVGQRYHFLGNPVTTTQPYLQMDPDDGVTSPQFIYYKPVGYDVNNPTFGHPVYNSSFVAPGMCKPLLANYTVYQDYLDAFALWARYVEDNTPYYQYYVETTDPSNPPSGDPVCPSQKDDYGYVGINKSSTSLAAGKGFSVHGAPANDFGTGGFLMWTGTVNNAVSTNISTACTKTTSSPTDSYDGRNLVGNPFPSPIDWQAVYNSNSTNFNPAIQVWNGADASSTGPDAGVFVVFTACTTGCTTPTIPLAIGQGFFVSAKNNSISLNFSNSHRMQSDAPYVYRKAVAENVFNLEVSGVGNKDVALFRFMEGTDENFDPGTDLGKMMNPGNSVYSLCKAGPLHLNYLPFPTSVHTVPVELRLKKDGEYFLSASDFTLDPTLYVVVLEDKLLNKKVVMTAGAKYAFQTKAGMTQDRFVLSFARKSEAGSLIAAATGTFNVYVGNGGQLNIGASDLTIKEGSITIIDVSGKKLYAAPLTFSNGQAVVTDRAFPAGVYMVTITAGSTSSIQKVFLSAQ